MRVVSFVNHLELEFEGNINKNAICLGDVDNDGQNELIVGNENGVLAVFKGESSRPVRVGTDLGMVTAIAVGDVFNTGLNVLVVVTGCGYCYIYDFEDDHLGESTEKKVLQPVHAQRIPSNVKVMLIGDVNGDGFSEMVVALTDRVVRTYRWVNSGDVVGGKPYGKLIGLNKWELGDQIGSITFNKCKDGSPSLLVAQPGGTYFTLKVQPAGQDSELDPFDEQSSELLTKMSLDYEPLASARLRNPNIHTEICGNIRLGKVRPSSYSSEGDANESVKGDALQSNSEGAEAATYKMPKNLEPRQVRSSTDTDEESYDVCLNPRPSVGAGCESIEGGAGLASAYALATLDGTLILVYDGKIQWNLQVDHQLFAVCALDVTDNGKDEVVACAWDGNTYIVCQNTDCVRFTFHEPVSAFTAGLYGLRGKQVPCLVYATFNNHIYLYHDITLAPVVTTTITEILKKEHKYQQLLETIGASANDTAKLRELNHFLLYGKLE
ncbi:KICSTOR complex protein ITFG2-like [Homarus americanus]|uniref:KICSTOR complex protein ITFG2-like n=1 Tax=Homarus americanus TaxID=6706 RepID=A0A8J5KI03_HOMAM|nr:KICSTOR complex protein ITFG2-like [Homarus americanus]KAG7170605.1 KICSTOR complex protein ITFG2-like [Homarus americanus]